MISCLMQYESDVQMGYMTHVFIPVQVEGKLDRHLKYMRGEILVMQDLCIPSFRLDGWFVAW